jgi:hypothetical protein
MSFPDKVVRYDESVLPHMVRIAKILKRGSLPAEKLLEKTRLTDVAAFVEAMDCLFALRKIEIVGGEVRYVA